MTTIWSRTRSLTFTTSAPKRSLKFLLQSLLWPCSLKWHQILSSKGKMGLKRLKCLSRSLSSCSKEKTTILNRSNNVWWRSHKCMKSKAKSKRANARSRCKWSTSIELSLRSSMINNQACSHPRRRLRKVWTSWSQKRSKTSFRWRTTRVLKDTNTSRHWRCSTVTSSSRCRSTSLWKSYRMYFLAKIWMKWSNRCSEAGFKSISN